MRYVFLFFFFLEKLFDLFKLIILGIVVKIKLSQKEYFMHTYVLCRYLNKSLLTFVLLVNL